nr:ABC transporter ATP-binding protein [Nanoarchaeota archaeon]
MTKKKNKNSIIEIRNLSKIFNIPHEQRSTLAESIIGTITRGKVKYEQLCALRNITLNIKKGEFIGIIGPNGSGKTTLLKIITGILEPERGSVKVIGNVVPFLELGIGFIQDLTAKENIYLYSSLLKLTKKEVDEKFDRIINFAEIKKFIDTPLKDFSTGMLARLAFSIAKEAEGDIYLIDEVLAVGDEEFQKKCISVFDDLKKKGKTVLFVSHSLDMVEKTCHRVIYLDSGKIVKTGSPKTVINTYKKKIISKQKDKDKAELNKLISSMQKEDNQVNLLSDQKEKHFNKIEE